MGLVLEPNPASIQSFAFLLINSGGTLQHRVGRMGSTPSAGNMFGKINNASQTLTNTPTGTDSTTDFATGVKISSATPIALIFDTAPQTEEDIALYANIGSKQVSTEIYCIPKFVERDVNGITRVRLEIEFYDATANDFDLNTTNISSGKSFNILFFGFLQ